MIKADEEERPGFLSRFAMYGGYVPRFFFLHADGSLNKAITSGHPRYPYFFTHTRVNTLKAAMRKAASVGS